MKNIDTLILKSHLRDKRAQKRKMEKKYCLRSKKIFLFFSRPGIPEQV